MELYSTRVIKPRRTFLYGVGKIGKSTFCSEAPGVIFIQTEDGLANIDAVTFGLCTDPEQVFDQIGQLRTGEHQFQNLAIDSVDWFEKLVHERICHEASVSSLIDMGHGRGYTMAQGWFNRLTRELDALIAERGMGVFLIAHAEPVRFEDPDTASYDRWQPKLANLVVKHLREWCDEIFFACEKVAVKKEEGKMGREVAKAVRAGGRILRTTPKPSAMAGNRLKGIPEEIPLSYAEYAKYLPQNQEVTKNG
jgi:hypothetical protein